MATGLGRHTAPQWALSISKRIKGLNFRRKQIRAKDRIAETSHAATPSQIEINRRDAKRAEKDKLMFFSAFFASLRFSIDLLFSTEKASLFIYSQVMLSMIYYKLHHSYAALSWIITT